MSAKANCNAVLVVPLPDGTCAAFDEAVLAAARQRAVELGFASKATTTPSAAGAGERWLTSRELAAVTGVGETTWESLAKRDAVPHIRCGRAVRFRESDVRSAMQINRGAE